MKVYNEITDQEQKDAVEAGIQIRQPEIEKRLSALGVSAYEVEQVIEVIRARQTKLAAASLTQLKKGYSNASVFMDEATNAKSSAESQFIKLLGSKNYDELAKLEVELDTHAAEKAKAIYMLAKGRSQLED